MIRSLGSAALLLMLTAGVASGDEAAPSAAPPSLVADPAIVRLVAAVDADHLRRTDARLVAFGTRNAFSERLGSKTRGVVPARDWIAQQFRTIAKASGGRMHVDLDTFEQDKTAYTPRPVEISSVYATLAGDDPAAPIDVISSHYDSRDSDGNDEKLDAPGADDNGSGVSAVLEAARVMASTHFRATVVFACFDGEEQGLFGSAHLAKLFAERGVRVGGDLNNDIIGASVGHGGEVVPDRVRLFSQALPVDAKVARVDAIGSENDSPSRELARFVEETDATYVPAMHVDRIYRADRFLRGGDQESFTDNGFAAVRFVEANENFDHQHQNVRVEGGVQYGDLLQYVDFDYLARVTQLNVAALATLALAPSPPVVTMDATHLAYDTHLTWTAVPGADAYEVLWRKTDEPQWTHAERVSGATEVTVPLSKDDWLFAVRSIDAAGHRSVAAFPTSLLR